MTDKERELVTEWRKPLAKYMDLEQLEETVNRLISLGDRLARALEARLDAEVGERDLINANKVLKGEVDQLLRERYKLQARVKELETDMREAKNYINAFCEADGHPYEMLCDDALGALDRGLGEKP